MSAEGSGAPAGRGRGRASTWLQKTSRPFQDIRARWEAEEQRVRDFVRRLGTDGVSRVIEYAPFGEGSMREVFWKMLQHVVNHASYHRGQVTTMLRQLGAAPPPSQDLITFYRRAGLSGRGGSGRGPQREKRSRLGRPVHPARMKGCGRGEGQRIAIEASGAGRGWTLTLAWRSVIGAGFALPRDAGRRPALQAVPALLRG